MLFSEKETGIICQIFPTWSQKPGCVLQPIFILWWDVYAWSTVGHPRSLRNTAEIYINLTILELYWILHVYWKPLPHPMFIKVTLNLFFFFCFFFFCKIWCYGYFDRFCRKYWHVPKMQNLSKMIRFWICMIWRPMTQTKFIWNHLILPFISGNVSSWETWPN